MGRVRCWTFPSGSEITLLWICNKITQVAKCNGIIWVGGQTDQWCLLGPTREAVLLDKLAKICADEILMRYGVSLSIISYCDGLVCL